MIQGSFSTGDQGASSDVDLMVIGEVILIEWIPVLRPIEGRISRESKLTIYSVAEVERIRTADHFLSRVLDRPNLMLLGSDDELARLGGKPLAG